MNKRGQGIQFNWIFVIVAGAIFLAFFIFFTVKYVELEEVKEGAKIVRTFDENLGSAKGLSQYKEFGEDLPDFDIEYNCEKLFVNDADVGLKLDHIVFMEDNVTSPLSLWSKDYRSPFLIDYVIYVWESDLEFFLHPNLGDDFIDELPNELKTATENKADILVYRGGGAPRSGKKVISFDENQIVFVNENKYFNYDGNDIFVYGAMFASPDVFECSKGYLEERFVSLKEIYIRKAQYFINSCDEFSQAITALRSNDYERLDQINNALRNKPLCEVLY